MNKKKSKEYYIYLITNMISSKQYVGSRTNFKGDPNITDTGYMGSSKPLKKDIEELRIENFTKEILEWDVFEDRFILDKRESIYMNVLDTLRPNGYNRYDPGTHPGWNNSGVVFSEEIRQKMSKARKGEKNPNHGKTWSEDILQKMRAAKKGKKDRKSVV